MRYGPVVLLLAVLLAATPAAEAKRKTYQYRVALTFTQTRPWTYHQEQTSPECTRTDDGHGSDVVTVKDTARINATERGVAGFGMEGTHTRTGARTHTVSGAECAPSAVFPSTWKTTTQTGGTVTAEEPNSSCGPLRPKANFPTLTLVGPRLVLDWPSDPTPDFKDCPYFAGANEASSGNQLPGSAYRDVILKLPRGQLRAGKRRVTATGSSRKAATETCATLVEPCAQGVTYAATGSVEAVATAVLTRTR